MRRRNCNYHLEILPYNAMASSIGFRSQLVNWSNENQMTISYRDATELQALAILWLARKETEEKCKAIGSKDSKSPSLHYWKYDSRGLSLKKSLQKFLQKRKDRIQASAPY